MIDIHTYIIGHPVVAKYMAYGSAAATSLGLPALIDKLTPEYVSKPFINFDVWIADRMGGDGKTTISEAMGDYISNVSLGAISNEAAQYIFHTSLFLSALTGATFGVRRAIKRGRMKSRKSEE